MNYPSKPARANPWFGEGVGERPMHRVARYVLIGPCLGACIGVAQTAVAAAVWVRHGEPDFYFRGWAAVELGMVLWAVGGAIAGAPFAVAVAAGERSLGRRVRVAPAVVSAVVAVVAATWLVVEWEFARRELLPAFAREGVAVAVAGVMALTWSRAEAPNRALHRTGD